MDNEGQGSHRGEGEREREITRLGRGWTSRAGDGHEDGVGGRDNEMVAQQQQSVRMNIPTQQQHNNNTTTTTKHTHVADVPRPRWHTTSAWESISCVIEDGNTHTRTHKPDVTQTHTKNNKEHDRLARHSSGSRSERKKNKTQQIFR